MIFSSNLIFTAYVVKNFGGKKDGEFPLLRDLAKKTLVITVIITKIFATKCFSSIRIRTSCELVLAKASFTAMSPVESDILFEKCTAAVLDDVINRSQMAISVHSIVKHQLMIKRSTTNHLPYGRKLWR